MKRRHFIHLGAASLVACGHSRAAEDKDAATKAGPFSITLPEKWRTSAIVEKKAIFPLYDEEEWKALKRDSSYVKKPGYCTRPQHWAIRTPAALPDGVPFEKENIDDNPTAPQILIHKADEWGLAATDGKAHETPVAEVIRSLRGNMDAALTAENPEPSPAFVDAHLGFTCLKRRIDFTGGHGVRLVTQWDFEANLMRLGELHYLFVGMSDDDTCQIIATFPISLPGLPVDRDKSHLGRSISEYQEFSKHHSDYEAAAKKWLEQNAEKITPSLATLDKMIESLVAPTWK